MGHDRRCAKIELCRQVHCRQTFRWIWHLQMEYKAVTGKSLKFKGSSKSANGIKKKSKSSADKVLAKAATGDVQQCEVDIDVPFEVDHVTSTSKQIKDTRTPAQRKFDDIRRIRQDREIEKTASMSHRERIEAMNTHLSKLSEHNDMPKIGPG